MLNILIETAYQGTLLFQEFLLKTIVSVSSILFALGFGDQNVLRLTTCMGVTGTYYGHRCACLLVPVTLVLLRN